MTTKKPTGKFSKLKRPIKDKDGKTVNAIQEQSNIWVEYFEELLNRPASLNPPDIKAAHTDLSIDVTPSTIETSMAIRQIKSGEAAEPDTMPAEALKSDREVTESMLYFLFRKIWEEKQVPQTDWKEKHLIKIPKKGYLSKFENYRGITLLSITRKVFNRVLLNQVKDSVDA
ncbi:unnamed protein product [Schistosoma curassoni]|uniref:Reverse transcriptase domain-containing protein n=1 Tax=Schistosoma curassoni TaxID=6186 RepID=A0A183K849_9TREM|nr:unnamed protein product [Schistosoma curassoni]